MRKLTLLILIAVASILLASSCSDPLDINSPDVDTVTIVEYDSTIVVQVDTLILNHYDTTVVVEIDTIVENVYDTTTIVEIDTLIINHYDTLLVDRVDTLFIDRVDTIYVETPPDTVIQTVIDTVLVELPPDTVLIELPPDTVTTFDTTFVELPPDTILVFDTTFIELPPDTVIQIITVMDTVYIPIHDIAYYKKQDWKLEWEKWSDTVKLNNPECQKILFGFDRITLGVKPYGVEPTILVNGEEYFFSVYGAQSQMVWFGPMEIPANAKIVIKFTTPYYGKVASPECHDFLKGSHWFIVNADSINYVP